MRYAVLGGSFDPVHNGHIRLAAALADSGYDRVILVPAACSPFKTPGSGETAGARLDLLLAAVRGNRRLTVDTCELTRGGVSYTIDTIQDLYERYVPEGKLGMVIGDDLAADFYKWKDARALAEKTDLIVARRLQSGDSAIPFPHRTIQNEQVRASSEELRALRKTGGAWEHLAPPAVRDLIIERNLYADGPAAQTGGAPVRLGPSVSLEDAARSLLDAARFLHTRNVALHSADLCARYGLPPEKGYQAGLCHDMCKGLTTEELTRLAAQDGEPFSALEQRKPGLLHGRAAAALMRGVFGIHDPAMLEAVRCHTAGKAGCGSLAKIVYLADKIEAGRRTVDRKLRQMAFGPPPYPPLDELFMTVAAATAAWLEERGLELAPETRELLGRP